MQQLLERIQLYNDQAAFKDFYEQYVFRLFQFAYTFVGDAGLSEEIVNDVFVKLWENRSRLLEIENISVYLYVAIKNAAFNYLRSKKRRFADKAELEDITVTHFFLSPDPEKILMTKELQDRIELAVNQLPPKCKLIFKMVKEDGLSYKETAAILSLSVNAVGSQITVALKKLEQLLMPFMKEYGRSGSLQFKS